MSNYLVVIAADYLILVIIAAPPVLWLLGHRSSAARAAMSGALAWGITWAFKNFYYLPRPFILSGRQPAVDFLLDGSFPSGHTALSLGIAMSLYLYHPRLSITLIAASFLVGVGRILAGVHSPADILGSTLVALLAAVIITQKSH